MTDGNQNSFDQVDLDPIDLQIKIEELVRSEYDEAWRRLQILQSDLEEKTNKWEQHLFIIKQSLVGQGRLDDTDNLDKVLSELGRLLKIARDFEAIMAEINGNPLLKAQWDKLLMSMRLVQNDD